MEQSTEIIEKRIVIRVLRHKKTDLLVAISDNLPGLAVVGISDDEIERKLPAAVRDFFEMSGYVVVSINLMRDDFPGLADFGPPAFVAHASLSASQA